MMDYNNLPVSCNYQFTDAATGELKEPKTYPKLFKTGQQFPIIQSLKFDNKEGNMSLSINYDESAQLLNGLPNTIA